MKKLFPGQYQRGALQGDLRHNAAQREVLAQHGQQAAHGCPRAASKKERP